MHPHNSSISLSHPNIQNLFQINSSWTAAHSWPCTATHLEAAADPSKLKPPCVGFDETSPSAGQAETCNAARNRFVCRQGTSSLGWSCPSGRWEHLPLSACRQWGLCDSLASVPSLWQGFSAPSVCKGFLGARCSEWNTFWFIASPGPPQRVSREFPSAANNMKMNRHENILRTPIISTVYN